MGSKKVLTLSSLIRGSLDIKGDKGVQRQIFGKHTGPFPSPPKDRFWTRLHLICLDGVPGHCLPAPSLGLDDSPEDSQTDSECHHFPVIFNSLSSHWICYGFQHLAAAIGGEGLQLWGTEKRQEYEQDSRP